MTLREIAQTYVGTPHVNACALKGVGVDCCTLPARILQEAYGIEFVMNLNYTADWYCKRECKEILLPILHTYCTPVADLEVGDILSYKWARSKYAHLALYLGNNEVIHSSADLGTQIVRLDNTCFMQPNGKSRLSGIWRLKDGLIQKDQHDDKRR